MGLGSQEKRRKMYYIGIKTVVEDEGKQKITDPHFVVQQSENREMVNLPREQRISGYLLGIGHGEYTLEKAGKQRTIIINLVDGDDHFKIEANINTNTSRGLMNRFLGWHAKEDKDFHWVIMQLGKKKAKDNPAIINPTLWIGALDENLPGTQPESMDWRFDYNKDLAPLIDEVANPQNPDKMIKVYHKANNLLLEEWIKMEKAINPVQALQYAYTDDKDAPETLKGKDISDQPKNPHANDLHSGLENKSDSPQEPGYKPEEEDHSGDGGDDLPF